MGVRTIFNILGPLTNPAGAPNILMGVFHPDLVGIQVRVLQRLGAEHALVVWGRDGMDEISLGAGTLVGELRDGAGPRVRNRIRRTSAWRMASTRNCASRCRRVARRVLERAANRDGRRARDRRLNAGAALYAAGHGATTIADGIEQAREAAMAMRRRAGQARRSSSQTSRAPGEAVMTRHPGADPRPQARGSRGAQAHAAAGGADRARSAMLPDRRAASRRRCRADRSRASRR